MPWRSITRPLKPKICISRASIPLSTSTGAFLEEVRTNSLALPNRDLDTGNETKAAEYSLTDEAYAKLLSRLSDKKFDLTSAGLRENILNFYSDLAAPIETKKDNGRWQAVLTSLDQLKLMSPAPTLASAPAPQSPVASN